MIQDLGISLGAKADINWFSDSIWYILACRLAVDTANLVHKRSFHQNLFKVAIGGWRQSDVSRVDIYRS